MYPFVLDSIKQHEIINGYNNYNKNDKSCYDFHKISSYKYIVLSIQKEVNFEANLLRGIDDVRTYFFQFVTCWFILKITNDTKK